MPFDEKKKLYGPARLAVGGPTEGADDAKPRVRNNDDVEPVAYHAKPYALFEELDHGFQIKAWVDLTCLTEVLPMLCISKRKSYLGLCLTTAHVEMLSKRIVQSTFNAFFEEGHPLYQGDAAKLVVTATAQASKRKVTPGVTPPVPNPSAPKKRRTRKPKTPDEKKSDLLQRLKKLGVNNDDGEEDPEDADDAEDLDVDEEAVDSGME
jgi:hypothetical protein